MKSLSAVLADEPLAALHERARWWGAEPPTDASADARQGLERAMRDTVAARFVWERLGDEERRTLFAIVGPAARNWQLVETLGDRAHLPQATAESALARLVARRLVATETAKTQAGELVGQRNAFYGYAMPRNTQAPIEEKLIAYTPTELATGLYATGRELFFDHADRSEKTLDELLTPYRQGDLDQIGRRFGLTVQAYYSRNEVRAAMAENLTQAEAVRYALGKIDPHLREVYEWLRGYTLDGRVEGRAPVKALRQRFDLNDLALTNLLHALEEYALIFDTFSQGERIVFIPKETMANLKRADARPQATVGLRECATPRAERPPDTTFLWDLAALTSAALRQEIELTRTGALPKRAALRLAPTLTSERTQMGEETSLMYIEFLKQVASDLGLVVAPASSARQRARLGPGAKIESWGRHDLVMQARRILRRWPNDRWWSDLPGAGYHEWFSFYFDAPLAREATQRLLRECKPGVWYSLASFRATILGDDPFVLRPSQRKAGEAGFKLAEDLRAQWEQTDGEVIAGIFRSTLYELGIVALGYDRESAPGPRENTNPDAFMLTELGAEVLHSELSAGKQPAERALIVQPNFQALLMEPSMPVLYWLARFASLDQVGRVSRFTLTREALARGLQLGERPTPGLSPATIDDVVAFLEAHTQKALPQNVVYTMRDWARQYKESQAASGEKAWVIEAR
ncbi:MAG TPA: hypothetical protein VMV29_19200, partial [Ktedonobacterales bacterium]|nr:hypothetical protein [Ktedonobacterales bacterium]